MKKRSLYILQICQSIGWGTAERMCFKEGKLLKSQGHEVFLAAIKDSPISEMAKKEGINCIPITLNRLGLLDITGASPLKNKIKNFEIQVVHNYSPELLWKLCYLLRDLPTIPLVMSYYSYPRQFFRFPLFQAFTTRIDKVFSSSKDMCEDVSLIYKIPKHRFEEMAFCYSHRVSKGPFQKDSKYFQIGMMVDWEHEQEDTFSHIFDALNLLNNNTPTKNFVLELFTNRDFESHVLYQQLKELAEKHGVSEWIRFNGFEECLYVPENIDLWLSFHGEDERDRGPIEDINDQVIEALGKNVPVLLARNGGSMELKRSLGERVEIYRPFEARDLALKINQIKSLHEKIKGAPGEEIIKTLFSSEIHLHRLVSTYHRLIAKRENFNRRRMLTEE